MCRQGFFLNKLAYGYTYILSLFLWRTPTNKMDKENVICTYNGILFSHKKRNPIICNNMDAAWEHYAK